MARFPAAPQGCHHPAATGQGGCDAERAFHDCGSENRVNKLALISMSRYLLLAIGNPARWFQELALIPAKVDRV